MDTNMKVDVFFVVLALTVTGAVATCWGADVGGRWRSAIKAFKHEDSQSPPPSSAIVFVGSSSIRMWTSLADDMAPMKTIRRGFGGSHMADVVYYAKDIILDYHPQAVVVYAGDNDIHAGKPPGRVHKDWRRLIYRLRSAGQDVPVFFVSIKPSPQRWAEWPLAQEANRLVRASCEQDDKLHYIDVASRMLNDKLPSEALYANDRLHLSPNGYALWQDIIRGQLLAYGYRRNRLN